MNYTLLLLVALNITPEDGSLLFIENGNRIVQNHTDSTITHVAIIFKNDNDLWVYEAVPPKVRKIKLTEYYLEIEKINKRKKRKLKVWISNPDKPLSTDQKDIAKKYLEKQIGRKYSIGGYLEEKPVQGIHCCELVGETLLKMKIDFSDNTSTDDPWSVWQKTKPFYKIREEEIIRGSCRI